MSIGETFKRLGKNKGHLPAGARRDIVQAARDGKPQVIDPRGSGMSGQQIAHLAEKAGNRKR